MTKLLSSLVQVLAELQLPSTWPGKGFNVTVYEKNAIPGGRCGQILRDGHRFDLGATIFLMPEIYRKVFKSLGLTLEECFDSTPLIHLYKIHFEDGTSLSFSTDKAVLTGRT